MKYSKHLGADIAGKEDALRLTPNPAVAEMITHLDSAGVETILDRFEAQQPQCGFGLRGLCCRMCQWGPCHITAKSPLGVCGRSMELIVFANLLRAVASGTSAQAIHAHEMILTLLGVSRGEISIPLASKKRLRQVGDVLNVGFPWSPIEETAEQVALAMLEDLGRMTEGPMSTIMFAPKERRKLWEQTGISPRSAGFEVMESLHMTTLGGCSDWHALILQALRTALAYCYSGLVTSSVLSDVLFGIPEPHVTDVNYGVLKADHVNILVHGHSPVMLEKVLQKVASEEIQALAREKGAEGIVVAGMCCSGHEVLARHGVPTVTGAMGQELVLGTGAVDAVVVDMQCVLPGMAAVAECFGTQMITTCRSNRVPGALHIPFDAEHPETLDEDAMRIARTAVEAFARRDRSKIHIPSHTTSVMTGFTKESVLKAFGSAIKLNARMERGEIRGIAAMVGCSTPKVAFESGHVAIARELIRQGVLVVTSGCSSHALLNAGLCSTDATVGAAPGLRTACEAAGIPPVLAMGSCSDNGRIIQLFAAMQWEAEVPLTELPFVVSGPELANEKAMGQIMAVLANGITAIVGLTPGLPVTSIGPDSGPQASAAVPGADEIADFFYGDGLYSLVGSRLLVQPDPEKAAAAILFELDRKRELMGWTPWAASPAAAAVEGATSR